MSINLTATDPVEAPVEKVPVTVLTGFLGEHAVQLYLPRTQSPPCPAAAFMRPTFYYSRLLRKTAFKGGKHHMRTASPKHAVVSAAVGARCLRACAAPQFSSIVVQFQHQFGKHRGRPDVERWHHVVFPVSSPPRICYNCVSFSGFRLNFKLGLPPPTRRVQIPARASVSARVEGLLLSFVLFFFFSSSLLTFTTLRILFYSFQGSGKTTLLNHILNSPDHGMKFAVIENEFGAVRLIILYCHY